MRAVIIGFLAVQVYGLRLGLTRSFGIFSFLFEERCPDRVSISVLGGLLLAKCPVLLLQCWLRFPVLGCERLPLYACLLRVFLVYVGMVAILHPAVAFVALHALLAASFLD